MLEIRNHGLNERKREKEKRDYTVMVKFTDKI